MVLNYVCLKIFFETILRLEYKAVLFALASFDYYLRFNKFFRQTLSNLHKSRFQLLQKMSATGKKDRHGSSRKSIKNCVSIVKLRLDSQILLQIDTTPSKNHSYLLPKYLANCYCTDIFE